jgi:copper resistance protein C
MRMSRTRPGRDWLAPLLIVAGLAGPALGARTPEAGAHALLLESTPKHNATGAAPERLVLRFNGRIEKRLSRVVLVGGPDGASIPLDQPGEANPDTLAYPLPALGPGPWEARWRVLSVDGHFTEGRVRFTVREDR